MSPTITCPSDITVDNDPNACTANITVPVPDVADNCGILSVINDYNNSSDASGVYPVGTTTVIWTVTDQCGHTSTCSHTITVKDAEFPSVTCTEPIYHCIESSLLGEAITGISPVIVENCAVGSITYIISGATIADGLNDASGTFFNLGMSVVTYTVTDIHDNTSTCSFIVEVYARPVAGASATPQVLCQNDDFTLFGTASGGSGSGYTYQWSGPNAFTSTDQNPLIVNAQPIQSGLYLLVVTDSHNCSSTNDVTVDITVNPLPEVTFAVTISESCLDSDPITLTGGLPLGGTYSGNGVLDGVFYPDLAGPGNHIITYTFTDGNGCTNQAINTAYVYNSLPPSVTVGTGGDYPTLTGNGGLFEAMNSHSLCHNLLVTIISNITEPAIHALNAWADDGNGPYTVTLVPDQPIVRNITGNINQDMIRINGADRFIIDGRVNNQGKYLLFRNMAGYYTTLTFMNDACNNTIRNCIIEGCNRTSANGVLTIGTGASTGNDNYLITEVIFKEGSTSINPNNLLSSTSTSTQSNSGIVVRNCEFKNFRNSGVIVSGTGAGTNWTIENNVFYYNLATAASTTQTVIYFNPGVLGTNNIIRNNHIGGSNVSNGGLPWKNSGSLTFRGIFALSGTYTIEDNVIDNIWLSSTGSASFIGIDLNNSLGGQSTISRNIIGALYTANSITISGTGNFTGINASSSLFTQVLEMNSIANVTYTSTGTASPIITGISANKAEIRKNKIYSLTCNGVNLTPTLQGIILNGISGSTNTCSNNMISLGGGTSLNPAVYGIFDNSVSNSNGVYYYNTVNLYGTSATGKISACFYRKNSTKMTMMNNLFSNFRSPVSLGQYAVYTISSTYWNTSNYNDFYSSSGPLAYWAGSNKTTLAQWQAASGKDANSISVAPVYFSSTNLHLTAANAGINNKGYPVATVTIDIDNEARHVSTPDIGCDEFSAVPPRFEETIPEGVFTMNIYPNPFLSSTTIEIELSEEVTVDMEVFTLLGDKIQSLANGSLSRGTHTYSFGSSDLPAGIYICRMVIGGQQVVVKRMQLVK